MGTASKALCYINRWILLIRELTFRTFSHSRSVPTRRVHLYPCRTGPGEWSRRSSTLRKTKQRFVSRLREENLTFASVWRVSYGKLRLTLLHLQLAGLTGPAVAHLRTGVFSAVEQGTALPVALQHGSLATAHRLTATTGLDNSHRSSTLR